MENTKNIYLKWVLDQFLKKILNFLENKGFTAFECNTKSFAIAFLSLFLHPLSRQTGKTFLHIFYKFSTRMNVTTDDFFSLDTLKKVCLWHALRNRVNKKFKRRNWLIILIQGCHRHFSIKNPDMVFNLILFFQTTEVKLTQIFQIIDRKDHIFSRQNVKQLFKKGFFSLFNPTLPRKT